MATTESEMYWRGLAHGLLLALPLLAFVYRKWTQSAAAAAGAGGDDAKPKMLGCVANILNESGLAIPMIAQWAWTRNGME